MRQLAHVTLALIFAVLWMPAALAAGGAAAPAAAAAAVSQAPSAAPAMAAARTAKAVITSPAPAGKSPESIIESSYVLTWEKDMRCRGRDPFVTVLHVVGSKQTKAVKRISPPRTPSEESVFVDKALSLVKDASAALDAGDFKACQESIALVREMTVVPLVTQTAKDKMIAVSRDLASLEDVFAKFQARAALTEALQLAARMQGYFDSGRFSEILALEADLQKLNTETGLKHAEVAATAEEILKKVAELKRRAEIHMEFQKMNCTVDAVSFFPEGRSYAIVNGEVFSEGDRMTPELAVAQVVADKVQFEFKGERIFLGLAEPTQVKTPAGKAAARRVR